MNTEPETIFVLEMVDVFRKNRPSKDLSRATITPWKLGEVASLYGDPNRIMWCVRMDRNGNSLEVAPAPDEYDVDSVKPLHGDVRIYTVAADNAAHAVKIANEDRPMRLASGTWEEQP